MAGSWAAAMATVSGTEPTLAPGPEAAPVPEGAPRSAAEWNQRVRWRRPPRAGGGPVSAQRPSLTATPFFACSRLPTAANTLLGGHDLPADGPSLRTAHTRSSCASCVTRPTQPVPITRPNASCAEEPGCIPAAESPHCPSVPEGLCPALCFPYGSQVLVIRCAASACLRFKVTAQGCPASGLE